LAAALRKLAAEFGEIDYASKKFLFDFTDYYVAEMGSPVYRQFYSFERLISPGELAAVKLATNAIEQDLAAAGKRRVNLDPGYLDTDKFVLASAKYNGHKIYLSHGIWADMTLHYEKGKFTAYAWSFPDFRAGVYNDVFMRVRAIYKKQLRAAQ